MKPQSEVGMPLIIEGSDLIEAKSCTFAVFFVLRLRSQHRCVLKLKPMTRPWQVEKWQSLSYASSLFEDKKARSGIHRCWKVAHARADKMLQTYCAVALDRGTAVFVEFAVWILRNMFFSQSFWALKGEADFNRLDISHYAHHPYAHLGGFFEMTKAHYPDIQQRHALKDGCFEYLWILSCWARRCW